MNTDFYAKVNDIIQEDPRYQRDAYEFVMQALWFTQKKLKRNNHVSGSELVVGIRDFVLEQYGPMAKAVIKYWGINKTDDFGQIVFNMINSGLLNKTEQDCLDDFKEVYDFKQAFNVFKAKFPKLKRSKLIKK